MTTPAQPPPKGKKKGIQPLTIIIVLGVGLAAGMYLLWRRRNSSAAAAGTAGTPVSTTDLEDFAGQIATLQTEIADLQSSAAQDEAGETGTGATTPGGTPGTLPAPGGFSVTPHAGGANFGWSAVPNARAYQLQVTGAGGKGTGTSHYDHAASATHASVNLAKGAYRARVRAGTSTVSLNGAWTPYKSFTVTAAKAPGKVKPPVVKGSGASGSGSGSGESEAA